MATKEEIQEYIDKMVMGVIPKPTSEYDRGIYDALVILDNKIMELRTDWWKKVKSGEIVLPDDRKPHLPEDIRLLENLYYEIDAKR